MQLIRKYYKGIHFLLPVIDVFSKYAWVIVVGTIFFKGEGVVKSLKISKMEGECEIFVLN